MGAKLRIQWPTEKKPEAPPVSTNKAAMEVPSVTSSGRAHGGGSGPSGGPCKIAAPVGMSSKEFEIQLRAHIGPNLRAWLRKQSMKILGVWLKQKSWPTGGSKEDLVDRIAFVMEGN